MPTRRAEAEWTGNLAKGGGRPLAAALSRAKLVPTRIHTVANVTLARVGEAFAIPRIDLETEAEIPGVDADAFQKHARDAKQNCPVSKALAGTEIALRARLL